MTCSYARAVAQLVARRAGGPEAVGSNPTGPTMRVIVRFLHSLFFFFTHMIQTYIRIALVALLLIPGTVFAQIQGNIPGSADPEWSCVIVAQTQYAENGFNTVSYRMAYELDADFSVEVPMIVHVQREQVRQTYTEDVLLRKTNGNSQYVSFNNTTTFYASISVERGESFYVEGFLDDTFCGRVMLTGAGDGQVQPFYIGKNFGAPTINGNINAQSPQITLPQQDRDDAQAEPINPQDNEASPSPVAGGVNITDVSDQFRIPEAQPADGEQLDADGNLAAGSSAPAEPNTEAVVSVQTDEKNNGNPFPQGASSLDVQNRFPWFLPTVLGALLGALIAGVMVFIIKRKDGNE